MNREGAETCLRRLAEAAMRRALAAGPDKPGSADPGGHRTRLKLAGQALLAVGALDGWQAPGPHCIRPGPEALHHGLRVEFFGHGVMVPAQQSRYE